jgi:DNA-directed RNA polymerase subunit beta
VQHRDHRRALLAEFLREKGIETIETLYTNEYDCGPFISDTLAADSYPQRA